MDNIPEQQPLNHKEAVDYIDKSVWESRNEGLIEDCFAAVQLRASGASYGFYREVYFEMMRRAVEFAYEGNWRDAIFLAEYGPSQKAYLIEDKKHENWPLEEYASRGIDKDFDRFTSGRLEEDQKGNNIHAILAMYIRLCALSWAFEDAPENREAKPFLQTVVGSGEMKKEIDSLFVISALGRGPLEQFFASNGVEVNLGGHFRNKKKAA